ncbi:FUSC family protein [Asaia prunellae]|uniref:FUSC family protein n=1 Tax=Asaia prunellae TaxID=610245 RepID=UPI00046EAEF7|nr:FUSC family protein [Asaia prunellae]
MIKGHSHLSATRPFAAFLTTSSNHLARYAITLSPEQLSLYEGGRAALVTALALAPSLFFDQAILAWIAFACFWACLIDPGGPDRERLQVLGGFTLAGTALVFSVSSLSVFGSLATLPIVALIGLGCGLSRAFSPAIMQLWVLAGCAAVAATGFPSSPLQAAGIAGLFCAGGLLAMLFCLVLWKQQPYAPARRSIAATYYILDLMARELAAGRLRETVHRQAARNAIERARALVTLLDAGHGNFRLRRRMEVMLSAAERVFTALLALEHQAEAGPLSPGLRHLLGGLGTACHEAMRQAGRTEPDFTVLGQLAQAMDRKARIGELVHVAPILACAETFERMKTAFARGHQETEAAQNRSFMVLSPAIWRHACRLSFALLLTQGICLYGGEGFSYWALIATLLVMQPAGNVTLVRSVERVIGSIGGSLMAALCAMALPGKPALLVVAVFMSLAAIATRAVNYTLLVFFLTGLVVVIAEAVMPGGGIIWARVLDNLIGSGIALLCVLLLWPQRIETDHEGVLKRAIEANFQYAALVLQGNCHDAAIEKAQREAGIASISAEFLPGGLPLLGGIVAQLHDHRFLLRQETLRALRRLSGEITLYRFDMQNGFRQPKPEEAVRFESWNRALARGEPISDIMTMLGNGTLFERLARH